MAPSLLLVRFGYIVITCLFFRLLLADFDFLQPELGWKDRSRCTFSLNPLGAQGSAIRVQRTDPDVPFHLGSHQLLYCLVFSLDLSCWFGTSRHTLYCPLIIVGGLGAEQSVPTEEGVLDTLTNSQMRAGNLLSKVLHFSPLTNSICCVILN